MLVLSRREGQKIVLPTLNVSIELLKMRGSSAKIGIQAPGDVPVIREEIAAGRGVDFAPSERDAARALRRLGTVAQENLDEVGIELNRLHQMIEACGLPAEQKALLERQTFKLFKPVSRLHEEVKELVRPETTLPNLTPVALLIEQDPAERATLERLLRSHGYEVAAAENGEEGLAFFDHHEAPELVLVDVGKRLSAGGSLVKKLRRRSNNAATKVFAIGDGSAEDLGVPTGPKGVDQWFSRPVAIDALAATISRAIAA